MLSTARNCFLLTGIFVFTGRHFHFENLQKSIRVSPVAAFGGLRRRSAQVLSGAARGPHADERGPAPGSGSWLNDRPSDWRLSPGCPVGSRAAKRCDRDWQPAGINTRTKRAFAAERH